MRQRVMIAIARTNDPDVIIAEEPTTARGVAVEPGVGTPHQNKQAEPRAPVFIITHHLGVVRGATQEVPVQSARTPDVRAFFAVHAEATDGRYELYKTTARHEGTVGRKQHGFPSDQELTA
jgi:ABC-type microcin C transport system duplicated ATPase subunit YejF